MSHEDPFGADFGLPSGPSPAGAGAAEPSGADLLDTLWLYLGGLRRRWKLVALITAAGVAAGAVHFLVTPPVYQAETTLLIERRSSNSLLSSQLPWLDHYFNLEFYPTQYRLLQSRGLAEQVALDLRLTEEAGFSRGAGADGEASRGGDRAALGRVANRLRGGLSVEPVRETQLVELTYRTDDPEQAARIANAYAEAFIEFSIRTRSETMSETSDVLTEEVARLKDEVGKLEEQVAAYSLTDMLPLSGGSETSGALQRLESLNTDLMDARRDRFETEARYRELNQMPAETVAAATASVLIGDLRAEKARLEREYESKSGVYKAGWPEMQELSSRIESTGEQLRQAVADEARRVRQAAYAEYQASLREEQAIAGEIERLKNQMSSENSQAVELANLQVELRSRRGLLDDLVRRQSETTFATRLQTDKSSNVRVVDRALVPGAPIRPSLPQDLGAGTMAGLLLGLGLGLLLQFLDRTIKSPEELERLSGLPVLAVVPDVSDSGQGYGYAYQYGYGEQPAAPKGRRWLEKKNGGDKVPIELLPHARPRLAVSETYRSLRTALLLSTARELRVVALTSVESSEGKTATAANLAVVLAQLGRRVLLIDGDLRKPRLHKVFGVSNRTGLVTYLTTGAADGLTHRTEVGGLSVMTSGPIPPNPSELLASDRMRDLLARLRESFDYVVIDSPPSLAVTDATILGAMADGVVLCVRSGRVERQDLGRVLDRLRRADIKLLGTLLNAHRSGGGASDKAYRAYLADAPEAETGSAA
ncbi:MAG TPA: polysaccharide biosynthesis tyrosine autokinase [Thermoanaerobaculia bacterium]|nr:polysaccharide biosynthesis tyrosine autokinase [Thermoanaerobaculia bacterium]